MAGESDNYLAHQEQKNMNIESNMETEKNLRKRAAHVREKMRELYRNKGYADFNSISVRQMLDSSEKLVYHAMRHGYNLGMKDAKNLISLKFRNIPTMG